MEERDTKYDRSMSYMEVYNEGIHDLLAQETKEKQFPGVNQTLKLRESRNGQTFVRGLAKHRVESVEHGLQLAQQLSVKCHTSSNNINADSSRSHCICQLELAVQTPVPSAVTNDDDDDNTSTATSGYTTDDEDA